MIVNICKELHYHIPINEISTAHRLKQNQRRLAPPNIVVRFKDRDIRNDVLRLKPLLRYKTQWRNYGIEKLFINEQLTPDKQKLLYQTKIFTREMFRIHGKIFVWSYKGDIYIRKSAEYSPKIKLNCEQDLNEIKRGTISLDSVTRSRTRNSPFIDRITAGGTVPSAPAPEMTPVTPVYSLQNYPLATVS